MQRVGVVRALGEVGPPLELLLAVRPADGIEAVGLLVRAARRLGQAGEGGAERQQRLARLGHAGHAGHREDAQAAVA
eukprot:923075-Prymnesium_polylepis.1